MGRGSSKAGVEKKVATISGNNRAISKVEGKIDKAIDEVFVSPSGGSNAYVVTEAMKKKANRFEVSEEEYNRIQNTSYDVNLDNMTEQAKQWLYDSVANTGANSSAIENKIAKGTGNVSVKLGKMTGDNIEKFIQANAIGGNRKAVKDAVTLYNYFYGK